MSHLEESECIEGLMPFVKAFSFTWFNLQAAKRRYQKQYETPMPVEMERAMKEDFMNQRYTDKIKWTARILAKLRKNIKSECRGDLMKTINEGNVQSSCIISNADTKNKMRRIDCLRQADKVWRLDVVMVVLFRGVPLESIDGERLSKCKECKNPALCINPYHIVIYVKELEVYLVNFINNAQSSPANIIPSVFSTSELQHMAISSISEGRSTKEVLGTDYLGSMLKMETDNHADARPISNGQQFDLLEMCRSRKSSLSSSPRTAKRRRTLNNTCFTDEGDDQDFRNGLGDPAYNVCEPKPASSAVTVPPSSTVGEPPSSSTSTCRISLTNDSNTYSTFSQQDDMNNISKPIIESSKMEPSAPRLPCSQIGIHNHVSFNLDFSNQQQRQHQQQQSQPPLPQTLSNFQQTSDSKLISERLIESLIQRSDDTEQQQHISSHPHTIQYFHQGLRTEPTSDTSKAPPRLFHRPITTTAINILPSRERPITTSSFYETSFVQPQLNEFKDDETNSNIVRFTSAVDQVFPAFHTFSELKSYLKTIGLDVELVPASNTTSPTEVAQQQVRNIDLVQQRILTNEQQQQYQIHFNTGNVAQTSQPSQTVMLSNNNNNRSLRNDGSKCNRTGSISMPPNTPTEKLLEYASSTLSLCHSQLSSRSSSLSTQQQQQRRSPSKPPIVFDIANLLFASNNLTTKDQPIVQQVTCQTRLPSPPPPPPPSSSPAPRTTVYHHLTSADKVSMMVKRNLTRDNVHLHHRQVEECMNMTASGRPSKQRKTTTSQTINDSTSKSIALENGSASNSNDSNVSSTSSSSSSVNHSTNTNNNNNDHHHHQANVALINSINKTKNNSPLSSQDSRNICDILLMLYEQERARSTQLQKQIEQVSRQHRSRNSSGQSHSSESQTGLGTSQGLTNENTNSTRMLSPAAWMLTSGKDKASAHIQQSHHQTLKFDSTTSINGSPPESQDCLPPDSNKSCPSPTNAVQFSQSVGSVQNLIPRPVHMLAKNDGLVRHTSSSSSHTTTLTGSNSSSNNGVLYTQGNRIFQSRLGQAFAALSPFLSPSASRAGTPSELMIIPTDLLNVLNSRIWSEDELLQTFVNHLDSGGSGRRSRVSNEELKAQGESTSMAYHNNTNGNNKSTSIEK